LEFGIWDLGFVSPSPLPHPYASSPKLLIKKDYTNWRFTNNFIILGGIKMDESYKYIRVWVYKNGFTIFINELN
jgi:hypothetical protein